MKQRHTAKRIFERLRDEHGYAGGLTVVKDYVRIARGRLRETFVPLAHPPGHAQVDFGEAVGVIGGVRRKIHFFCMDLPHSDAPFVKAYPAETTEAFLDGHVVGVRLLRRRAAVDPLRQHHDRGGEDLRRRQTGADPGLHRAAEPLPVPGSLRPSRQGQRQRQGRGAGEVCPVELPDADPAGGELRRSQRHAGRALPAPTGRARRTPRARRSGSVCAPIWRPFGTCPPCRWSPARSGLPASRRPRWSATAATTIRCRRHTASGTCW